MNRILLLLCTAFSIPAFVPPPKPSKSKALPTFGQIIKEGEERRQQAFALLPADVRREMLLINTKMGPVLNIPAMVIQQRLIKHFVLR